ncbi:TRAP transporter substrate-binding protein [Stappia sp.]|uniref:TRAP transporter substrate-binding protein n=1 Tax=Stappia sp. TaxID=1870903 RepID=UPI003A996D31
MNWNALKTWMKCAAVVAMIPTAAAAQDVTLTIHHFLPATGDAHVRMIQPWADKVAKESDGRIAFEIFPSMSMGGKATDLYTQARDGVADVVWTALGYTPGVFPRSEVFELPLVHRGSAEATSVALNKSFDLLEEDFRNLKIIFLHAHDGNLIHSATRPVRSFEDVKGLKLRTPSRTGAWLLEEWGAEPVGMPVPDLPQAMSKGVVDGALTTYEIVPVINLQEMDKFVSDMPGGRRFGTTVFMMAMNQDRYDSLPDDLKAIIDANSGVEAGRTYGAAWEDMENRGIEALDAAGAERIELSEDEAARFDEAAQVVVDRWIEEMKGKGIDGAALVSAAQASVNAAMPQN